MKNPLPAYKGSEPYVFVSYSHADEDIVFAEIRWLQDEGINVWYDTTGIGAGSEWNDEIARAIKSADHFLYFITPRSVASEHCRRELNFAQAEGRRVVVAHLEATDVPDGLRLSLDNRQAILKHRLSASNYQNALTRSLSPSVVTLQNTAVQATVSGGTRRYGVLVTITLLCVLVGAWWFTRTSSNLEPPVIPQIADNSPSIAVLPFINMSDDPDQEYFADGVAEEILSLLARNPELKVISRSSAFSFKGKSLEVPAIAEQLGVKHVLDGSVRKSGNRVRITTQLIDATSDAYLWSETFDRALDDVFAVQTEIAKRVADQLNVTLLNLNPPDYSQNSEAYLLFSQARHILGLSSNLEDTLRAKALLDQAVQVEPSFVPAWRELARAYDHLTDHGFLTNEDGWRLGDEVRAKALSLNPNDAVANAWDGWTAATRDGDFSSGVRHFEKGLSLDPTNLDILRPAVPLLQAFGQFEESLDLAEYVVDRDPLCVICIGNLARSYINLGRLDEAERLIQRAVSLSPDNVWVKAQLGETRLLLSNYPAALNWFEELPAEPRVLAGRAIALHEMGRSTERDDVVALLAENSAHLELALYFAWTENVGGLIKSLESAIRTKQPWHQFFQERHLWGSEFQRDSRWLAYLEKLGLSQNHIAKLHFNVSVPS